MTPLPAAPALRAVPASASQTPSVRRFPRPRSRASSSPSPPLPRVHPPACDCPPSPSSRRSWPSRLPPRRRQIRRRASERGSEEASAEAGSGAKASRGRGGSKVAATLDFTHVLSVVSSVSISFITDCRSSLVIPTEEALRVVTGEEGVAATAAVRGGVTYSGSSSQAIRRSGCCASLSWRLPHPWQARENMESTSDVQMQHCAEDSETTIEIKIKTLDSQTYNLRVNKCVPVPLLKEKIATVTGILSEQQRLICRGRVLKDDELLSAYHVEDGHTLHLVVRHPGQSATSGNAATEANTSNSGRRHGPTVARSVVLEAVNVDPGSSELPAFVAQILQSVLGTINAQSSGTPTSSDTGSLDPSQSSIPNTIRVELDQQQAPLLFQSEPAHESSQPNVIPDALTTMSQYIDFMRDSFRREGFSLNGQTEGNVENRTAGSTNVGGTQNQEGQPESASVLGLHNASLLAENMHSTRQIIVEQAGALLSQLSAQLGDLENVTDPAIRRDIQSSAVRTGSLFQNLGSLLLELGRTTMLLRINPSSSEAVVNSGPALYISPSGPNPLMVQPVPFPGRSVQMGTLFSSLGSQGSVPYPRDVDIHVRTSGSVTGASTNPSESAGAQAHQNVNRPGGASHANIGEAFSGVAGGTPFSVESGVRLLPLRTVVAMPAGISRAPSGSSSGGLGIIYPFLTRVRQRANTNGNDERNGQSPNESARSSTHPNQQSIPQSSQTHEAGNLGSPVDVNVGDGSEASPGQQNGLVTLSQIMDLLGSMLPGENVRGNTSSQQPPMASTEQGEGRNLATPEVSGASEEALRFAGMVRQIMPFISQVETQNQSAPPDSSSTPEQAASGSVDRARDAPNDSTSSRQHNRDQIDEPNSKRQRTSN